MKTLSHGRILHHCQPHSVGLQCGKVLSQLPSCAFPYESGLYRRLIGIQDSHCPEGQLPIPEEPSELELYAFHELVEMESRTLDSRCDLDDSAHGYITLIKSSCYLQLAFECIDQMIGI